MFYSFSPNMLKTYEICPQKFYFKYVKNINMPVNEDIFEFGKNIHALASYYLKGENIDRLEKSLTPKEDQLWKYLKNISYFDYECINTEYNLSFKKGEHFFGGRLDALMRSQDNRYYILDYKTGSIPKNAKFDYQTMIYLLAVKTFFQTDSVTFVYLDLKNNSELKIDLTSDLILEYETRLITIADKISKEDYSFQLKSCPCEFNIICYH